MEKFTPAKGLRNRHLQSIISSTGPRQFIERRRSAVLLNASQSEIITTPQGVKLLGALSKTQVKPKGLAILLHGWEGCSESLYMLSNGQQLLDDGFDVFRLNFRDHGGTQHLNRDLFNSMRLEEMLEAVKILCDKYGGQHNLLCGYSLGGNFCLRIANLAQQEKLNLHQAIAVCPLLHPPTTMNELNNGVSIYEKYFVKRWKSSLFKKLKHHSHFNYGQALKKLKTLDAMNDFFVLEHTDFKSTNDYFEGYSILGDRLNKLAIPTTIITSLDDPIIPARQLNELFSSSWLTIDLQQWGGHCAFIKNWKLESWVSERVVYFANQQYNTNPNK
jgi:predicted alpha/beta-fold hydrolase